MGIILDADQNQEYIEDQLKKELEKTGEIPESISTISKRKIKEIYIPPEEEEKLLDQYSKVVVQDFEDDYHMTKEERESLRERYSKFFRLKRNYTKKIRRLDKYIEACRLTVEIIRDTAETNGVMDPDEFITDVFKGRIVINGLSIPKYQGKGKKTLNWDYIMEFILDPTRDIDELVRNQESSRCKDVEEVPVDERPIEETMSKEDYEAFMQLLDDYHEPNSSYYDGSDNEGFATVEKDKERKGLLKIYPGYTKKLKEMYNQDKKRGGAYAWQLEDEDLQWIREFKEEAARKNGDSKPVFTGSIMDDDAVGRYLFELEEWENDHELVKYGQSMITREQMDEIEFKQILEANGYNLRNLYGNKERRKRIEKQRNKQSKEIKSLKKMLEELKSKQEKTNLEGLNGTIEVKDIGGDKVNKKKKKKKKVKGKKAKEMEKHFDNLLLDAVGSNDKDMKSYQKRMTNMKWEGGDY